MKIQVVVTDAQRLVGKTQLQVGLTGKYHLTRISATTNFVVVSLSTGTILLVYNIQCVCTSVWTLWIANTLGCAAERLAVYIVR